MWDPGRLTILWALVASYEENFNLTPTFMRVCMSDVSIQSILYKFLPLPETRITLKVPLINKYAELPHSLWRQNMKI
jgi:hypothetical protein